MKTKRRILWAVALLSLSSACKEDKDVARKEADQAPVEISATPEGLMEEGAVREIQEALRARGYEGKWKDGDLDAPTSLAIRKFQEAQSLPATGAPDQATVRELGIRVSKVYASRFEAEDRKSEKK